MPASISGDSHSTPRTATCSFRWSGGCDNGAMEPGGVIEFFPEDTVTIPLWNEEGLLPDDPEWLREELGLSQELIEDLTAWARDWDQPPSRIDSEVAAWIERLPERRAEGRRLFERLKAEVSPRFTLVNRFDEA
jgi:hypothetical protein